MNALLPLAALVDERVAQPDTRAQIEDVIRRDPGLRQATDHHQLAQQPGIGTIGLRRRDARERSIGLGTPPARGPALRARLECTGVLSRSAATDLPERTSLNVAARFYRRAR
jgi:hypothetical protein